VRLQKNLLEFRLGSYIWGGCRTITARAVIREGGKTESLYEEYELQVCAT